ncbi:MAG: MGMT family protein [Candidatus Parvarchaeota archaeon]|jgi:O-6-methylguanine DNA methyltransferase|nr:MGMT family protein [Candidatus Parvarchaeota archaeon]MCW1294653.1 MGMT family protein [Candidatus Parvarchaeum tengchongense]MCW1295106.1 MGMT family protein [Candidatus Parvarchaeum tengchongense]MCW1312229.1 MGMT family protein [Candidatus Parvarchaeum tengchongense]
MKTKEDKVYLLLTKIPRGKVTTYGSLARKLNISPREVGKILSRNEHPEKFPCYKVVRSDGSLGGYTIGKRNDSNTLKIKKKKLVKDGVKFHNNKVDRSSMFYNN